MYEDKISIIDCKSKILIKEITVGNCPSYLLLSSDQKFLYVSNSHMDSERGGFIAIVDLNKEKIIKRIRVGKIPRQMAMSPREDYLYIVNSTSNSISIINLQEGREIKEFKLTKCLEVSLLIKMEITFIPAILGQIPYR